MCQQCWTGRRREGEGDEGALEVPWGNRFLHKFNLNSENGYTSMTPACGCEGKAHAVHRRTLNATLARLASHPPGS